MNNKILLKQDYFEEIKILVRSIYNIELDARHSPLLNKLFVSTFDHISTKTPCVVSNDIIKAARMQINSVSEHLTNGFQLELLDKHFNEIMKAPESATKKIKSRKDYYTTEEAVDVLKSELGYKGTERSFRAHLIYPIGGGVIPSIKPMGVILINKNDLKKYITNKLN